MTDIEEIQAAVDAATQSPKNIAVNDILWLNKNAPTWIQQLLDKVRELEGDFDTCYKELEYERKRSDDLEAALRAEQARTEVEREKVKRYGKHEPHCMRLDYLDERDHGCTCGLEALTQKESGNPKCSDGGDCGVGGYCDDCKLTQKEGDTNG